MTTIGDIADRIERAKLFSAPDASLELWHIELDGESSRLVTMSTPYERCRFERMLFGICTEPKVFEPVINEGLDGLTGTAVVMDDILAWKKTHQEHDENLRHLLQRCREVNLQLYLKKIPIVKTEVCYLGQEPTGDEVAVDQETIKTILEVKKQKIARIFIHFSE